MPIARMGLEIGTTGEGQMVCGPTTATATAKYASSQNKSIQKLPLCSWLQLSWHMKSEVLCSHVNERLP